MSKVIENYVLKEAVGSGQYGKVFKSVHQKTGKVFAVKVIKNEKFRSVPKLQEFTNNEIQTLTKLRNVNVITFVEMLRTTNNVYLVYDFCNGGTLEDHVKKRKFLTEREALVIFQQIVNAFKSLFKENILHRDLKPSNILLHDGVIKVADFGFCKTLLSSSDLTQTMVGSPIYMAPEILKGCNYNIKADIWSMGVVLFEMLFGFCPYEDKTIARLIGQIDTKTLVLPKHINRISSKIEELLLKMLTVDPIKRIDWNDLLTNPLFQETQQIPNQVQQLPNQGQQMPNQGTQISNQVQTISGGSSASLGGSQFSQQIGPQLGVGSGTSSSAIRQFGPTSQVNSSNTIMTSQPNGAALRKQNEINEQQLAQQKQTLFSVGGQVSAQGSVQQQPSLTQIAGIASTSYSTVGQQVPHQFQIEQIPSSVPVAARVSRQEEVQNFLKRRNKILYQIKALNTLLDINEAELTPLLGFMLMKSVWNQTEQMRVDLLVQVASHESSQQLRETSEILQHEIEVIKSILVSFQEEIDALLAAETAVSFKVSAGLRRERGNALVDFSLLKQTLVGYVETMQQKFVLTENMMVVSAASPVAAAATAAGEKPHLVQIAQYLNQLLNTFLADEYFSNSLDPRYNDLEKPHKYTDVLSLVQLITYKLELTKNKQLTKDKQAIFF